ncbi:MAG: DUF6263 family protein [Coprothermobacterota bacterium]|nr:DUF6263 family protein [Coprothermobacterota bacterium]
MKRFPGKFTGMIVVLVAVLVLAACQSAQPTSTISPSPTGSSSPTGQPNPSVSPSQNQVVSIKLNLQQGETYGLKTTMTQTIHQTIESESQVITQTYKIGYFVNVTKVEPNGNIVARAQFSSVAMKMNAPGMGEIDYDSASTTTSTSPETQAIGAVFGAMVGKGFSMTITPTGAVQNVTGLEELVNSILDSLGLSAEEYASSKQTLEQQFSAQAQQDAWSNSLDYLPSGPVSVGQSWKKQASLAQGFPILLDTSYRLKDLKGGIATIDVSSTIQSATDAGMDLQGLGISYQLSGTQAGTIQVRLDTGWIGKASMQQSISGTIGAKFGDQELSWPMSIETQIEEESQ